MAWRDAFIRWFGPGMLGGITFGDWVRLLRDNRFDVSPRGLIRAVAITAQSTQNSVMRWVEDRRYGRAVRDVEVTPPVFVLGHWRSGTTLLHNLLAVDERFAFPNNYQAIFPHAFLSMEATQSPFIGWFPLPAQADGQRRVDDAITAGGRVRPLHDDVQVALHGLDVPEAAPPLRPLPDVPRRS